MDTLLLIVSNAMMLSERFPQADRSWEDLTKIKKDWAAWKKMYKAYDQKAKVKNKQLQSRTNLVLPMAH